MWNKKVKWFDESYKWIFLGIAIIGGPLMQIVNFICSRLFISTMIHTIIVFGILVFQIIGLISACITIHKYNKLEKSKKESFFNDNKKSIF